MRGALLFVLIWAASGVATLLMNQCVLDPGTTKGDKREARELLYFMLALGPLGVPLSIAMWWHVRQIIKNTKKDD